MAASISATLPMMVTTIFPTVVVRLMSSFFETRFFWYFSAHRIIALRSPMFRMNRSSFQNRIASNSGSGC